jgi:hypothetical protein
VAHRHAVGCPGRGADRRRCPGGAGFEEGQVAPQGGCAPAGAEGGAQGDRAIYFPFTDVIVADPYADIADGLKLAFYIGQCQTVGGVTTDMVAYASADVFVQAWIGAVDKLPRRVRAVYRNDPLQLRHQMEFSNWQVDFPLPAEAFTFSTPSTAKRIEFARPDPIVPEGIKPPPKRKPAKSK